MKYMGSKRSIAKYILPIIFQNDSPERWYIETFVGGCNLIDKVVREKRWGNDNNYYLIEMYKALQSGWIPPEHLTEDEYIDIRNNKDNYDPALVSFVGFACSYGGKWFGGYARGKDSKGNPRDHANEAYRNVIAQSKHLQGIKFTCDEYWNLDIPDNSIIYCDPPYEGTTKYKTNFDHTKFWNWVREVSCSHEVYISEYKAPDDFECIWSKQIISDLACQPRIEKLFIYKG